MAFSRLTGKSRYKSFPNTAVALVAGVAAQFDEGGFIAVSATDKTCVGIVVFAAALSTNPTIDIIDKDSIWRCNTFSGTFAATDIGKLCTLGAGLTPDITATTNGDLTIIGGDVPGNSYIDVAFNNAGLSRMEVGAS